MEYSNIFIAICKLQIVDCLWFSERDHCVIITHSISTITWSIELTQFDANSPESQRQLGWLTRWNK